MPRAGDKVTHLAVPAGGHSKVLASGCRQEDNLRVPLSKKHLQLLRHHSMVLSLVCQTH